MMKGIIGILILIGIVIVPVVYETCGGSEAIMLLCICVIGLAYFCFNPENIRKDGE